MNIKILILLIIFTTRMSAQSDFKFIKSDAKISTLPNKYIENDSFIYGVQSLCTDFEEFKYEKSKILITKYNKFTEELKVTNEVNIDNENQSKYQVVDLFNENNSIYVIFSKNSEDIIFLYKAKINSESISLDNLIEFGRMPYTTFTFVNTYRNDRTPSEIQNIYSARTIDNKSICFYTYLKDEEKKFHIKRYNENLELKWEGTFDLKDKSFYFGNIKEVFPLTNGETIVSSKINNKTKFYKINESGTEMDEILIDYLDYNVENSKIVSSATETFLISMYAKRVSNKIVGFNIYTLNHESNESKNINITKEIEDIDEYDFEFISTTCNDAKLQITVEQDILRKDMIIGPGIFLSVDKDLQSYKVVPFLKKQKPMTTNLGKYFSFFPLKKDENIVFLQNTNEKFRTNYDGKNTVAYGAGLNEFETDIVTLKGEKIEFKKIEEFGESLLNMDEIYNMNKNTLIFKYEKPKAENGKIGILRY
jgi:hypothetical protein